MARLPRQLTLDDQRRWGGKRAGAGRKRISPRPLVPHRRRAPFTRRAPLHVTVRMAPHVYSLRSRRALRAVRGALYKGAYRFDVRVVQLSLQGNHMHMLVEAPDPVALRRAMTGLGVRLAHRLNRVMGTRGRVIDERYHARRLRTPAEVRAAINYIRDNHQHHGLSTARIDPYSMALAPLLPAPTLWLLTVGPSVHARPVA